MVGQGSWSEQLQEPCLRAPEQGWSGGVEDDLRDLQSKTIMIMYLYF